MTDPYRELRARAPELFRSVIEHASSVAINHRLGDKVAADIEKHMVSIALLALNEGER